MSGERLQDWAPRVRRGLERLPAATTARFDARGPRLLSEVRSATPKRTGSMARSWRLDARTGRMSLASAHPGVAALELGARIQGRPWLAVPIGPDPRPGGPRLGGEPLFTLQAADGRLFLATRNGGSIELRYRLLHHMELRARPFVAPAVATARAGLDQELLETMRREVGPV